MGQNVPKMSGVVDRMTPRAHGGLSTGERIRVLMGRARVNRPQLAEWCHVSVKSMARYEKDEIMPTGDILGDIAVRLGTSTDYLLGLTDDPDVADPDSPTRVWLNHALATAV